MTTQTPTTTSPLLTILLMTMINEKQSFALRCSVLYLLECFLFKNETKKAQMVESLLLSPTNPNKNGEINAGQLLCSGLFSSNSNSSNQTDFVSTWLCACSLSHCIRDNLKLKEQLLRVHLAIGQTQLGKGGERGEGKQEVFSLLQQCMNSLIHNGVHVQKFQTKCALLMFLSTWLANCHQAVDHFLQCEQNVLYVKKLF